MTLTLPKKFNSMAALTKREAIITRELLVELLTDGEYTPLKPAIARVIKALDIEKDEEEDVIGLRRRLNSKFGLVESRRKTKADKVDADQGLWLCRLTDFGYDFFHWLEEEEAKDWGTENHPTIERSGGAAGNGRDWTLGELGFVVETTLPYGLWREVNKEVKAKGYRTVIVPPEGKVYLGVEKDGKNKAVPIPSWEKLQESHAPAEPEVESKEERRARLKAELAKLDEDN